MASKVIGAEQVRIALAKIPDAIRSEVQAAAIDGAKLVQQSAVAAAPTHSGNMRDAFKSGEAVGPLTDGDGRVGAQFGLITSALMKRAYYAMWVEFGNKGYDAGGTRDGGRDKGGGVRKRKVKRSVPARPAQPFLRPALDANRERVRDLIVAAVNRASKAAQRG